MRSDFGSEEGRSRPSGHYVGDLQNKSTPFCESREISAQKTLLYILTTLPPTMTVLGRRTSVTLSVDFQYKKILFRTKKLSL